MAELGEPARRGSCRRNRAKDEQSWRSGAAKGNRSRWALRNLPPIEDDDLGSILLTLERD